jgi:hypothetical protein
MNKLFSPFGLYNFFVFYFYLIINYNNFKFILFKRQPPPLQPWRNEGSCSVEG